MSHQKKKQTRLHKQDCGQTGLVLGQKNISYMYKVSQTFKRFNIFKNHKTPLASGI
jgi:hypothetical protein